MIKSKDFTIAFKNWRGQVSPCSMDQTPIVSAPIRYYIRFGTIG